MIAILCRAWTSGWARAPPRCAGNCETWWASTSPPTSWARSPRVRPIWRSRSDFAPAGRPRPAVPGLAGGVRRPERLGVGADRRPRGDVGAPRTPGGAVHGRQLGRAGHHAARDTGAAAAAPAADRPWRGDLVPGLQRAGRRIRPGVAADGGPPRAGR